MSENSQALTWLSRKVAPVQAKLLFYILFLLSINPNTNYYSIYKYTQYNM